nr:aminoacetone oxidase family FAD-binding enzyme [uncultured Blautia sp.]
MEKKRVCIVGGGAAGMMAAIIAAREGAAVTVLEHNEKTGKKILATGNGRCNLTNLYQDASCYHSQERNLAWEVLEQFDVQKTIRFFSELGIYTKNKNGGLYPSSMQASSVQELLEMEARYRKVKIKCREHVTGIQVLQEAAKPVFQVKTETWSYEADAVILACGSKASAIEGADGSGYTLAKSLGLKVIKPLPALVPLKGKGTYFTKWAGTRVEGKVILKADAQILDTAEGELQLTDYGISGIPVFQLSSQAARLLDSGVPVSAELDFLPDFDEKGLEEFLKRRENACPYKTQRELLTGLLPKKLADVLSEGKTDRKTLVQRIKRFAVEIKGTKAFDMAQVCSGGVSLTEINPKTMECRKIQGIYLAGELLDTDGICGGYNLQWAWSSGACAGYAASKRKGEVLC